MKRDDKEFEEFLREFTPCRPAPFRSEAPAERWRRLAAAAAIVIAVAGSAWVGRWTRPESRLDQQLKQDFTTEQPQVTPITLGRLRTLVNDPKRLDAALTHASRQELPDFRDRSSAFRGLAKE
jgi:hypothetical protein